MNRPVWKGSISFGLVSIPVVLFPATEKSSHISFRQTDRRDNARIRYKRINAETGREVPWEETGKAYEYDKEHLIPVGEKELEKIPGVDPHTIAIESFTDRKNIQLISIQRTYYLVPDKAGEKGYLLLKESLDKTGTAGIAKILISTREYLAAISVLDDIMVVYLLHYAEEMAKVSDLPFPRVKMQKQKITEKEREVAAQLIRSMKTAWRPERYKDAFVKKFNDWLERKIRRLPEKKKKAGPKMPAGPVTDFVALMRRSLKNKAGRSGRREKKSAASLPLRRKSARQRGRVLH